MAFEKLLNKPLAETELLDLLVEEVQQNYKRYQNIYCYFKLSYVDERKSEVIWLKTFENHRDFTDFYYDTKFFRAAIMLKFKNGRYEVFCEGFQRLDVFELWPNKISNSRPLVRFDKDYEKMERPPRELIERGFGEITQALASSKSRIPM